MEAILSDLGMRPDAAWLRSCRAHLTSAAGTNQHDTELLEQFIRANLAHSCGGGGDARGCLPEGVADMHDELLNGPYLLQVAEAKDVSMSNMQRKVLAEAAATRREAQQAQDGGGGGGGGGGAGATAAAAAAANAAATTAAHRPRPGRMLRLSLTDGTQFVGGMEYRPVPLIGAAMVDGEECSLVGLKLVVKDAWVRRGYVLLTSDCVSAVLGGGKGGVGGGGRQVVGGGGSASGGAASGRS